MKYLFTYKSKENKDLGIVDEEKIKEDLSFNGQKILEEMAQQAYLEYEYYGLVADMKLKLDEAKHEEANKKARLFLEYKSIHQKIPIEHIKNIVHSETEGERKKIRELQREYMRIEGAYNAILTRGRMLQSTSARQRSEIERFNS